MMIMKYSSYNLNEAPTPNELNLFNENVALDKNQINPNIGPPEENSKKGLKVKIPPLENIIKNQEVLILQAEKKDINNNLKSE